MMRSAFWTSMLSVLIFFPVPCPAEVPLPNDINIISPTAGLPQQLAAFPGRWHGNWSGKLESVFIVEEIDTQRATVVYAWGDAPDWQTVKGFRRLTATVSPGRNDELQFKAGRRAFIVQMSADLSEVRITALDPPNRAEIEYFKRVKQ